jgi:predicted metalloprotease
MTKIRSRDSSRIQDRRGSGGGRGGGFGFPGGGGGFPIPTRAGGGGLLGILVLLAIVFLPRLCSGSDDGASTNDGGATNEAATGSSAETCSTELEQILCGATNDVQDYFIGALPAAYGQNFQETRTVFFSGFTDTGCGQASAETGPFYCPADNFVYFDLDFLVQLQEQFAATGDLAAQYIVAHEFGHHVQNVLGANEAMRTAQEGDPGRANEYSIALELQADCYAGAWARSAADRGLLDSQAEITEALDAAAAVGDDRIQQQTQGRVDPESWTHGSSEQRVAWFRRGFDTGDPAQCTTFEELGLQI